jgi:hypothetical protein
MRLREKLVAFSCDNAFSLSAQHHRSGGGILSPGVSGVSGAAVTALLPARLPPTAVKKLRTGTYFKRAFQNRWDEI